MAKTALPVSFRLSPGVKAAAEKAAADDQRSLSSLIEKLLTDHLKRHGYLAGSPKTTAAEPEPDPDPAPATPPRRRTMSPLPVKPGDGLRASMLARERR